MGQSLIQMPKEAKFEIAGWPIRIRRYMATNVDGLSGRIWHIIQDGDSDRQSLYQFEKRGVSFEAAIECCVSEMEHDGNMLTNIIWHGNILKSVFHPSQMLNTRSKCKDFSESMAGRKIAEQFIEKIRSCDNWGELYDEMQMTSKFNQDMKNRIIYELEQQCRKV